MDWHLTAANLGAAITLGLGVMGLVSPHRAATFVSIRPDGLNGRSELRATYGGFFLALGLACLLFQEHAMFLLAGLAWMGAAGGRILSVLIDRNVDGKNIIGIFFEAFVGFLLLMGG